MFSTPKVGRFGTDIRISRSLFWTDRRISRSLFGSLFGTDLTLTLQFLRIVAGTTLTNLFAKVSLGKITKSVAKIRTARGK